MKTIKSIFRVLIFILLFISMSLHATNVKAEGPPADGPWTKEYVDMDFDGNVGTYVSIDHHPLTGAAYISYYDAKYGNLWMAQEVTPGTGNCRNNNNWKCTLVDSTGDVGKFSSIKVVYVAGSPVLSHTKVGISYFDATNRSLKMATYTEGLISPSWTIEVVDEGLSATEVVGTHTSLMFDADNKPVIGYHVNDTKTANTYGAVKLASYVGSGGSGCVGGNSNWTCQTIDRVNGANHLDNGSFVSIDQGYEGVLYLAFYNSEQSSVDYAYYQGFGGSCSNDQWNCVTVDKGPGRGKFITLKLGDRPGVNKMRFVYYDKTQGKIRYAEWAGSGGNCANSAFNCYAVDTVGTPITNYGLSMDLDLQGLPIIAYMDAQEELGPSVLKVARPVAVYGEGVGNCGDVPPGFLFQYWKCKTIDNADAYLNEAIFVGVSVSPGGLPTIAYSEYDDYHNANFLKAAQLRILTYLPIISK